MSKQEQSRQQDRLFGASYTQRPEDEASMMPSVEWTNGLPSLNRWRRHAGCEAVTMLTLDDMGRIRQVWIVKIS